MTDEKSWVESLKSLIKEDLDDPTLQVEVGYHLPYALDIMAHEVEPEAKVDQNLAPKYFRKYETDLLIVEVGEKKWIPRVVAEFKLRGINTHDALTYSAKAATHKSLYPHLRYGIVVGEYRGMSPKVLWHGQNFDFMLALSGRAMEGADRQKLSKLLTVEVEASRTLGELMVLQNPKATLIHRRLIAEF